MQAPFWSQGLNRYSYVFNNPLQWVDPSGFNAEDADDGDGVPEGGTLVGTTGEGDCGSGDCFAGGLEYVGPSDAQTQDETPAGSGDATGESAQAGDDPEVEYAQEDNEFESEALNYDADDYGPPTLDDYLSSGDVDGAGDAGCCGLPQTLPSGGPWIDPNDVPEPVLAALGLALLAASPIPNSSRDSDEYLGPLVRAAHLAAEAELEGIPPGAIGMAISRQQALTRMEGLATQVRTHLDKLARQPTSQAAGHWRAEVRAFTQEIQRLASKVGQKTGAEWQNTVSGWLDKLDNK